MPSHVLTKKRIHNHLNEMYLKYSCLKKKLLDSCMLRGNGCGALELIRSLILV